MGVLTMNIDSKAHKKIIEDLIMPAIVQFPTVVRETLDEFGPFFVNELERKHFAKYITGLIIANKKNVSAINRGSRGAGEAEGPRLNLKLNFCNFMVTSIEP